MTELVPQPLPDDEKLMPFWDHLGELRDRLIRCVLAVFGGLSVAYFLRFRLWALATRPLLLTLAARQGVPAASLHPFAYTDLAEPFFSLMRLSFWASVFVVSPYLFYQVWAFIRPALRPRERRMATTFVFVTSACFILGALFAYFFAFESLSNILLEEAFSAGLRANMRPDEYLNLFLYTVVGIGVSFEAPVLFYFLARFRLVTSAKMLKYWREATIAILFVSAFLTPGDVVATTILFGVILLALYFVSALVVWLVERGRPPEDL
jgi:sec-independent protein translocase protein TatC